MRKAGPGELVMAKVISPDGKTRLLLQIEDLEQIPLAHMELTKAEAELLQENLASAIRKIWGE